MAGILRDLLVWFGSRLKIDSPRISLSARILYGLYFTAMVGIVLIYANEGTPNYGELWSMCVMIILPPLFLVFLRGVSRKTLQSDEAQKKSLSEMLGNENKKSDARD